MGSTRSVVRLTAVVYAPVFSTSPAMGVFHRVPNWVPFNPGAIDIGYDPDGYEGAVLGGRYVYFASGYNGTQVHGEILRSDTSGDLPDPASWDVCDPMGAGVTTQPEGFVGSVFDARYVYFAPCGGAHLHSEVLRYDTAEPEPIPAVSEWDIVVMALLLVTAGTVTPSRTRSLETQL